nr:CXXC-type zinc finger protein 1-like [Onthophagus taurus]XP_022904953.1 CXXC-type zinc finger protein 1-like [Onthophagus taurus]XP_022904954.1 CXXC-type zinc finger protein 1-like [Onthophagus taurus]XP_022904955.1 CXXC-type zinc finger protein 1-like [Onthophagus taurus]XP_022904956.1 CXXC-type zinc finger protein 1-like [Onthophagus taurus]
MSRKKDISREEIAKQFLLPERQSKIDTLLKQDGQAYCICRSSDSSRFMIACDACEEWYHGDCISISEKEAKLIKQYFCIRCTEEDNTLQTRWKTKREENASYKDNKERDKTKKRKEREPKPDKKQKKCGDCMGCYRTEDCGRCDVCTRKHKYGKSVKDRCKQRVCVNYGNRRKRRDSGSDNEPPGNAHLQTDYARQCYGPACKNSARFGSKYCSDTCGHRLATNRIYQVLPQRIQEWALSPCLAEEKNIKNLEEVRKQQMEVQRILHELDKRHRELDLIIERARNALIDPNAEYEHEDESEMSMYCITCGHEIHSKTAIKHMEKCFNKYESQASFGSVYKTRIEGNNMFCDFFNPINKTYCKRLRVLCPEHCKDPKIGENEVCGCPLVTNVFDLTGEFCRAPKKSCTKHYVWEKLRRAEVDLERVRQWLKMDELLEKERQIRQSMASRAGVLALMLHSTYNHEVMEEITKASQQDQHAMQRELSRRFRKRIGNSKTRVS